MSATWGSFHVTSKFALPAGKYECGPVDKIQIQHRSLSRLYEGHLKQERVSSRAAAALAVSSFVFRRRQWH